MARRHFDRQHAGRCAEAAAARYLQAQQLTILLRNYRCRTGELDIVAQAPGGTVVIAEVRMRSRRNYGGGAASVDRRKQRKIVRATHHLLLTHRQLAGCALRFDVLDLQSNADGFAINWIRHAFEAT
jgi:putative endonuclease